MAALVGVAILWAAIWVAIIWKSVETGVLPERWGRTPRAKFPALFWLQIVMWAAIAAIPFALLGKLFIE